MLASWKRLDPASHFSFPAPFIEPVWYPRQESNLYLEFRKPSFYPLNYGDAMATRTTRLTCMNAR